MMQMHLVYLPETVTFGLPKEKKKSFFTQLLSSVHYEWLEIMTSLKKAEFISRGLLYNLYLFFVM